MRYVFDVDGVVADFVSSALVHINDLIGTSYRPDDVTMWAMESMLPDHMRQQFFDKLSTPGFCRNLGQFHDAVAVIRELQDTGHEVVFATSPWSSDTWINERTAWLHERFGPVDVHHLHDKTSVSGDVFVDDKPSHIVAWAAANPQGWAYLMNRPYNQEPLVAQNSSRIYRLEELLNLVPREEL